MAALWTPVSASQAAPVLVRDAGGVPLPPTEIVERLQRIHPSLGLKFSSGLAGRGWAVIWHWPEHDRRRAWVQDGRTDPDMAHDIIGYLPFGCPVQEAPAYIENSFKQYPREEVSRLRARMHHWNTVQAPAAQHAEVIADTMDDIGREQRAPKGRIITVGA